MRGVRLLCRLKVRYLSWENFSRIYDPNIGLANGCLYLPRHEGFNSKGEGRVLGISGEGAGN